MISAPRDANYVPTEMGVSSTDLATPTTAAVDPTTHEWLVKASVNGATYPSTSTVTSVADTITPTTLIAADTTRKELIIANGSSSILYILFGSGTVSATNYTAKLNQDDVCITNFLGVISGVWSVDSTGAAYITSET